MTNSIIRNFFETLRSIEDALLPYVFILSENFKSNEVIVLQTDPLLNFRTLHFKRSNVRMFIFVLTIDCVIYKSKKVKKQNKKHLELKTWYFRL